MCLVVYAMLLALPNVPGIGNSELLPGKNFALYIDHLILGRFDDGTQYTWILSGLGFTATTMTGLFAGEILRSTYSQQKKLLYLLLIGVSGIVAGQVWGIWHPIVKKLWTSSFVLFLSGICFLLMAFFYWIIDVKQYKKWTFPLRVIGINSITAYVVAHVINMPAIANFLTYGLEQYTGAYYEMIKVGTGFLILYLFLWYLYKNKTYIKI